MPNTYSLLCYTREATGREEANNEDIAYSMHLALRLGDDDGARWRPLNENYGIFFAAGVPIAAVPEESRRACTAAAQYAADPYEAPQPASEAVGYGAVMPGVDITLKSLKDPFLFRLADGRFGIAATRTDRGGAPDGSERSAFLVAVSRDLTSFEQLGLVRLRTDSGVNRVSVAYQAAFDRYVISWIGDNGESYAAQTGNITAEAGSEDPLDVVREAQPQELRYTGDCGIANAVPGNVIPISETEAKRLTERFGRIRNVGASVPAQHADSALRGEAAKASILALGATRAELAYSDGSRGTRAVDWDAAQLEALASEAAEGTFEAGIPIVDEHSYQSSSWWFHNLDHYDHIERKGPKVYLGEYGSWGTQLINGLSEAAFMGRMELNGDVVAMASYAPLFAKNGHHSWDPDLIYFDNERTYLPYSYWVQQMYAATTADIAWPVGVEGATTFRRNLPDGIRLRVEGGARADLNDLVVTTASGARVELGDVQYRGSAMDLPVDLHADSYCIDATVVYYEGKWGIQFVSGDIDGKNHNVTSLGRGHEVKVVRDGTAYALGGTEWSMNDVQPGTTWRMHVEIADRGQSMKLYIDGTLVAEGTETKDEPRRTITVSRSGERGETYVRVVNAMAEPAEVDISRILAALDVSSESAAGATATILTGEDPYAGRVGEESPTSPVKTVVDLTGGVYAAPAWSFSTIVIGD